MGHGLVARFPPSSSLSQCKFRETGFADYIGTNFKTSSEDVLKHVMWHSRNLGYAQSVSSNYWFAEQIPCEWIWITSMNNNSQLWPVQSSHGTRLKPQNVGLTIQMLVRIWIPTHLAIFSLKTARYTLVCYLACPGTSIAHQVKVSKKENVFPLTFLEVPKLHKKWLSVLSGFKLVLYFFR